MRNLLGNEIVQEQRGNCKNVLVMLVVAFVLAVSCSLFAGAQEAYAEPASGADSSAAIVGGIRTLTDPILPTTR